MKKEFGKEVFEWFKTVAVEDGIVSKKWKNDLIDYIYNKMIEEGKTVKKESIRRNLNRMIAYYYETGAQARSGRRYLNYIKSFLEEIKTTYYKADPGLTIAKEFLTTEEAKLWRGELRSVLKIIPSIDDELILALRFSRS